jgi:hypothetical protein
VIDLCANDIMTVHRVRKWWRYFENCWQYVHWRWSGRSAKHFKDGCECGSGRNWVWYSDEVYLQNEEVEVAFREYLRMRHSDLYRYGNFKLLAKWGKCINVLGWGLWNNCAAATLTAFNLVANLDSLLRFSKPLSTSMVPQTPLVTIVLLST